jgi:hypothetical protein
VPAPATSLIDSLLPCHVRGYRHDEIVRQVVCFLCHFLQHLHDSSLATISVVLIPGISQLLNELTLVT